MTQTERVLVVGAHSDDVDFSSAGTMIKWAREGKEIYYLICTDGDKGGTRNDLTANELMTVRRAEQEEAAAIVGVKKVFFLGHSDGELVAGQELKKEIVRIIRQVRPNKVFSFDPGNNSFDGFFLFHSDHRAVAISVFDAIYPAAKNRLYFPELLSEGLEPHKVQELYMFGSDRPNVCIDISDVIDLKIKALRCHRSQFEGDRADMIEEFVRQRGKNSSNDPAIEYAESFRIISFPF